MDAAAARSFRGQAEDPIHLTLGSSRQSTRQSAQWVTPRRESPSTTDCRPRISKTILVRTFGRRCTPPPRRHIQGSATAYLLTFRGLCISRLTPPEATTTQRVLLYLLGPSRQAMVQRLPSAPAPGQQAQPGHHRRQALFQCRSQPVTLIWGTGPRAPHEQPWLSTGGAPVLADRPGGRAGSPSPSAPAPGPRRRRPSDATLAGRDDGCPSPSKAPGGTWAPRWIREPFPRPPAQVGSEASRCLPCAPPAPQDGFDQQKSYRSMTRTDQSRITVPSDSRRGGARRQGSCSGQERSRLRHPKGWISFATREAWFGFSAPRASGPASSTRTRPCIPDSVEATMAAIDVGRPLGALIAPHPQWTPGVPVCSTTRAGSGRTSGSATQAAPKELRPLEQWRPDGPHALGELHRRRLALRRVHSKETTRARRMLLDGVAGSPGTSVWQPVQPGMRVLGADSAPLPDGAADPRRKQTGPDRQRPGRVRSISRFSPGPTPVAPNEGHRARGHRGHVRAPRATRPPRCVKKAALSLGASLQTAYADIAWAGARAADPGSRLLTGLSGAEPPRCGCPATRIVRFPDDERRCTERSREAEAWSRPQ